MNKDVKEIFNACPNEAQKVLIRIRGLIYEVAEEEKLGEITESLKWGEPSYSSIKGSPIRTVWNAKSPEQVSIFFNCKTKLIGTFRELHRDTFQYIGNRQIVIPISEPLAIPQLKSCISMALRYHLIKKLPLLGK